MRKALCSTMHNAGEWQMQANRQQLPMLNADLSMQMGGCEVLAASITLLERIDATGSLTRAAKECGISYRTAWQTIERLQNRSTTALVERSAGGANGGGSRLTGEGKRAVALFRAAEAEHRHFMALLGEGMAEYERQARFMRRWFMKTSIRNELYGTVQAISKGAVNTEVTVGIGGDDQVVAIITNEGAAELGLSVGMPATALLKESSIFVCSGETTPKISARNRWLGRVLRCHEGTVFAEITAELPGSKTLTAMISFESMAHMEIWPDSRIWLCCKASDVILASAD